MVIGNEIQTRLMTGGGPHLLLQLDSGSCWVHPLHRLNEFEEQLALSVTIEALRQLASCGAAVRSG